MSSSKRIMANQANARHSTGPRSDEGKARSRRNAFKHGLAVPAAAIPEFAEDATKLARMIIGSASTSPYVIEAATKVAEATIDVLRARRAQVELLDQLSRDPDFLQPSIADQSGPIPIKRANQKKVRARIRKAILSQMVQDGKFKTAEIGYVSPDEAYAFNAEVIRARQKHEAARQRATQWEQLEKLDRYMRRSLSRRNLAIRALDALTATKHVDQDA